MSRNRKAQSGQAIILMALAMAGILAFAALGIDGSRWYYLQRDAQSAADSGATAAAYADCFATADPIEEAKRMVLANGFNPGNPRVKLVVTKDTNGYLHDFTILLTAEIDGGFSHIFFPSPLIVTVKAVGRCTTNRLMTEKAALFAMGECQDGIAIQGSDITVLGSAVSNTDLKVSSSNAIMESGYYAGSNQSSTGVSWTSISPLQGPAEPDYDLYNKASYMPGGQVAAAANSAGLYTYSEKSLQLNTNAKAVVMSGLYFIDGDFSIIGDNYTVGPWGFTIVATGKITMSATNLVLKPYVDNLLLFSDAESTCGNNSITLSSSTTTWGGIIYAPYGGVRFSDSGNSAEEGGIIADHISISASSTNISRNPGADIMLPPSTVLQQ